MITSVKRIAKNTLFLYFRMMCIMFVSLFTSRVVLNALGVEDYGLYQTVGGIVTMLSFLNSSLSTGSSRFLTFELGKGISDQLRKTFCTLLLAHFFLAIVMVLIGFPVGFWFLKNHVVVPADKMISAFIIFCLSIVTSVFSITQVPYTAVIIAHERLSVYAYISIVEVVLKLGVGYIIRIANTNKLVLYALLLTIIQVCITLFYRFFCLYNYKESKFKSCYIDFKILIEVGKFSSWSLVSAVSSPLMNQGTLILLNNFFSPVIVTARSVSIQVSNAANQFISNFRTASNPQIVKLYSSGNYDESKRLLLMSTVFSFYLMLFLALPIYLLAEPLLKLWLIVVPDYSVFFLKWAMITSLFSVFDVSFYTALYTKGRLKENALLSPIINMLQFPILYLAFISGYSPNILAYSNVVVRLIIGCIVKPFLICKICEYKVRDVFYVLLRCFIVFIITIPMPCIASLYLNKSTVFGFIFTVLISIFSTLLAIILVGLDKEMKKKIKIYLQTIRNRLHESN